MTDAVDPAPRLATSGCVGAELRGASALDAHGFTPCVLTVPETDPPAVRLELTDPERSRASPSVTLSVSSPVTVTTPPTVTILDPADVAITIEAPKRGPGTASDGVDDLTDAAPLHDFCPTTLYFWEDFTGDPSALWTSVSGTWSWDGAGALVNSSSTPGAVTWIGPQTWTDYTVRVELRLDSGSGDAGILLRAQEVSDVCNGGAQYYLALYPGTGRVLLGVMNGDWHPPAYADTSIEPGLTYAVRATVTGDSINVDLDDKRVLTVHDGEYAYGSVGLRTYYSPATYESVIVCD